MQVNDEKKYLEALAEYVYGKNWRETVTSSQWDILIVFAAAREVREIADVVEKLIEKKEAFAKVYKAGSLPRRNWSASAQDLPKYVATLRQFIDRTANLSDGNLEAPPEPPVNS